MIDDHEGDGRRNPATVEDGLTIQSTMESAKKDGKVKEKFIGVGNGQFTWIYGMGTGVFRALGLEASTGLHILFVVLRLAFGRSP